MYHRNGATDRLPGGVQRAMNLPAATSLRGFVWAALSTLIFAVGFAAPVGLLSVVHSFADIPRLVELALWSVVWGTLAVAGVLVAGRVSFDAWLPVSPRGLAIAAVGTGLSAAVLVVLNQWQTERFGSLDPDYVGWTFGLFAVLIGIGTAGFALDIAPRRARLWPLLATLAGAGLTGVIIAFNVPGVRDGIEPESWPLAILIGVSGLYAAGVGLLSLGRLRHDSAASRAA